MTEDNICPKCGHDSESGDGESYADGEYSAEFICEVCECQWTSYYKFDRKEVDKIDENKPVIQVGNIEQFRIKSMKSLMEELGMDKKQ